MNHRVRFHSISSDLRGSRRPSSAPSLDSEHNIFASATAKQYEASLNRINNHYYSVTESSGDNSNGDEEDHQHDLTTSTNNQKNEFLSSQMQQQENHPSYINSIHGHYNNTNYGGYNANTPSTNTIVSYDNYNNPSNNNDTIYYSPSSSIPGSLNSSISGMLPPSHQQHSTPATNALPISVRDEHKENTPPYAPGMRVNH